MEKCKDDCNCSECRIEMLEAKLEWVISTLQRLAFTVNRIDAKYTESSVGNGFHKVCQELSDLGFDIYDTSKLYHPNSPWENLQNRLDKRSQK